MQPASAEPGTTEVDLDDPPQVAIVNHVGFHNEVYAALLWSFQSSGGNTTVFVDLQSTWDIQDVLEPWYSMPFQPSTKFLTRACEFDVVVVATFPEHHMQLVHHLRERACPGQRLVLMVHNPDMLLSMPHEAPAPVPMQSLIRAHDTHLLSLAPHTVTGIRAHLERLKVDAPVSLFVPVFPISLECTEQERLTSRDLTLCEGGARKGFILQGLLQTHRRNYGSIFQGIARSPALLNNSDFHLDLIGMGSLEIPEELVEKVAMHTHLPYRAYYRMVRNALAVLPAFASDIYYTKKASSSVAAAVVCSTPLIASQRLLSGYHYLNQEAVYLSSEGESDVDAMVRVLSMPAEEVERHVQAVNGLQEDIYRDNDRVTADILAQLARRPTHQQLEQ